MSIEEKEVDAVERRQIATCAGLAAWFDSANELGTGIPKLYSYHTVYEHLNIKRSAWSRYKVRERKLSMGALPGLCELLGMTEAEQAMFAMMVVTISQRVPASSYSFGSSRIVFHDRCYLDFKSTFRVYANGCKAGSQGAALGWLELVLGDAVRGRQELIIKRALKMDGKAFFPDADPGGPESITNDAGND